MSSRQSNGPDDGFEVPVPDAAAVAAGGDPELAVVFVWMVADVVPVVILLAFAVVAVVALMHESFTGFELLDGCCCCDI